MTFEFRPAGRENVPLLIGLAGGTGSGKTMSAMRLAKGLSQGEPFYVIDTENGRAKHYADLFEFQHGELHAPFQPIRYAEALEAAAKHGAKVIVVDSMSHEWAGDGGMLDMHEAEMRGDESRRLMAWIKPKLDHKRFVSRLLQLDAHVILCFRAEPKVEMKRDNDGKWQIVPKASLVGLDGWIPISEKNLPYELTASFLLTADEPGVPKPIKLQEQHRDLFPAGEAISEEMGAQLAVWASGAPAPITTAQKRRLNDLMKALVDGGWASRELLADLSGRDVEPGADGRVHFAPLRDSLTADEADRLAERFEAFIAAKDAEGVVA